MTETITTQPVSAEQTTEVVLGKEIDDVLNHIRSKASSHCVLSPRIPFAEALKPRTQADVDRNMVNLARNTLSDDVMAEISMTCNNQRNKVNQILIEQFSERSINEFAQALQKVQTFLERNADENGEILHYYGGKNYTTDFGGDSPSKSKVEGMTLAHFLKEVYAYMHTTDSDKFGDLSILLSRLNLTDVNTFVQRPITDILQELHNAGY